MTPSLLTDRMPSLHRAGMPLPGGDYRTLPRVSNSDLTRLKEEHLGYWSLPSAGWATERTRTFGKAFHQHLLEPESVATVLEQLLPDLANSRLTAPEQTKLDGLMRTIRQDTFCRRYLRIAERRGKQLDLFDAPIEYDELAGAKAERERAVLFTDPETNLACKARLDLVYTSPKRQSALVMDFKTTSARTQAQFLQSCYDYDYDRQAAFYIDSLRHAESGEWDDTRRFRFVFIGVMKQKPHRLFAVDATSLPDFLDYGRKKYRFWLKKWRETNGLMD